MIRPASKLKQIAFLIVLLLTTRLEAQQIFSFPSVTAEHSEILPRGFEVSQKGTEFFLSAPSCDDLKVMSDELYHWAELGGRANSEFQPAKCGQYSNQGNLFELNLSKIVILSSAESYKFYVGKLWLRFEHNFPEWPRLSVLKLSPDKIVVRAESCAVAIQFEGELNKLSHVLGENTSAEKDCREISRSGFFRFELSLSKAIAEKLSSIMEVSTSNDMLVQGPNCFGTAQYLLGINSNLMVGGSQEMGIFLKSRTCRALRADQAMAPGDFILYSTKLDDQGNVRVDALANQLYKSPQHIAVYIGSGTVFEKASVQGFDRPQFSSLQNNNALYSVTNECTNQTPPDSIEKMEQSKCKSFTETYRCDLTQFKSEITPSSNVGRQIQVELDTWMREIEPLLHQSKQNCYIGSRENLTSKINEMSKIRKKLLLLIGSTNIPRMEDRKAIEDFFFAGHDQYALFTQYARVMSATRLLQNMLFCLDFKPETLSSDPFNEPLKPELTKIDLLFSHLLWPSSPNPSAKPN